MDVEPNTFYSFLTSEGQLEFDKKLVQYDTAFEAWTNLDDKYKLSQEQIIGRESYYKNLLSTDDHSCIICIERFG